MHRGAPMTLMVMMTLTAVMAAGCGSNGGGGSGSIRPLGEEVNTEAEYITVSCANEVQACLLPCPADDLYVGLFIVQLGTSLDAFPFDDSQACVIQQLHHGDVVGTKTYANGAKSAVQYILNHGRLKC